MIQRWGRGGGGGAAAKLQRMATEREGTAGEMPRERGEENAAANERRIHKHTRKKGKRTTEKRQSAAAERELRAERQLETNADC